MDDRTLTALKESIAHWERNVAAETISEASIGPDECALCHLFNNTDIPVDKDCIGCPVRDKTKRRYCERSPYLRANDSFRAWERSPDCPRAQATWHQAAQRELDFLIGLLPPEHVEPERVFHHAV